MRSWLVIYIYFFALIENTQAYKKQQPWHAPDITLRHEMGVPAPYRGFHWLPLSLPPASPGGEGGQEKVWRQA